MIAYLLVALFALAAVAALSCLADSAIRAGNALRMLRAEMAQIANPAPTVDVVKLRPRAAMQRSAMRRPVPRLPRAVAA
ncbi:hypothetical protein P7228_16055 [Altererythrobacter arenosus]|uniref:Uncharacterized protein n=1 Tax=Altererythrobacter arenosus TaxID=3032592 RepID=A0ABY8FTQ9_9SPHN|nr:hypothetical protein [Altererythrobacter sp. CAU 1644]WFL77480.1 hypothetical protein P7228_16055 [Altererythrobacter sp. CAU 1644]